MIGYRGALRYTREPDLLAVDRAVTARKLPPLARDALAVTLAAQFSVAPLLIGTFGELSLFAPLANLLASGSRISTPTISMIRLTLTMSGYR